MKKFLLLPLMLIGFMIVPCKAKNYENLPQSGADIDVLLQEREIAKLDGRMIYLSDLNYDFNNRYTFELHNAKVKLYREQQSALHTFIDRMLLEKEAEKQKTNPDELLARITEQATAGVEAIDAEKENLFQDFVKKISKKFTKPSKGTPPAPPLVTLAGMFTSDKQNNDPFIGEVKNKVVEMKKTAYLREKKHEFLEELRTKADIELFLERPELIHLDITPDDDPSIGREDAPITIITFADYQCPFCSRGTQTLKELVAKRGDNIRVVLRDFPLPSHKDAKMAAEAAECADEQGKFWEYSDIMFSNQQSLTSENLQEYATRIGLNSEQFGACLNSGKQRQEVNKDIADAKMAGISSTPSLLINGYYIAGIPSLDYLEEVIAAIEQGKVPKVQEHMEKG